jgi:hypothetical protein
MRPAAEDVKELEMRMLRLLQDGKEIGSEVILSMLLMLVDLRLRVEKLEGAHDDKREIDLLDSARGESTGNLGD